MCPFRYGEIVNVNLVRDKKTGKSKGFCFICYEDQRSTILAVDNFNGIKVRPPPPTRGGATVSILNDEALSPLQIKGRTIRVDHVKNYRPPKDGEDIDDVTKRLREDGCAPTGPAAPPSSSEDDEQLVIPVKKPKKGEVTSCSVIYEGEGQFHLYSSAADKKEKKKKKKEKKKSRASSSSPPIRVKEEKRDTAYDKYTTGGSQNGHNETERRREEKRRDRDVESKRETEREREDRRRGEKRREADKESSRR